MIKEILINRFDGGMQDDFRSKKSNGFAVAKHFDILTNPHRLIPIRGTIADTTGQHKLAHIIVGTDGLLYGIGESVANPTWQVQYKKASLSGAWALLAGGSSGAALTYTNLYVEYKDWFYTARSGYIMRNDRAGTTGVPSYSAVAWATISQGVVHPAYDKLYIPYTTSSGCFMWSLDGHGGTPNLTALTLPTNRKITSIVPYGNYLAIATVAASGSVNTDSIVYLWDCDEGSGSLFSETINWGTGSLQVLNTLDGYLIGIADTGGASSSILDRDSIQIKVYGGGVPQVVKEISTRKQTITTPDASINSRVNFVYRSRLYFSVSISGGGTSPLYNGLSSIGRNQLGEYAVTIERMATNDGSETGVRAAAIVGDFTSCVHTADGTVTITQNNSDIGVSFSATSFWESLIFDFDSPLFTKKLIRFSILTKPLPDTDSAVVVKYRIDEDIDDENAGWTTLLTHDTDNAIRKDDSGYSVPHFKEIQFRLESTYKASITGFYAQADVIKDRP